MHGFPFLRHLHLHRRWRRPLLALWLAGALGAVAVTQADVHHRGGSVAALAEKADVGDATVLGPAPPLGLEERER